MKYLYLLLFLIPTLLHAQVPDVLPGTFKLSSPYPEAGKTITLIYQPKKHIDVNDPPNILVHFSRLGSRSNFQDELCYQMEYRQKQWVCNFKLPRATVAFYVRLYNGGTEADEWPMLFQSLIYRNKKPVEHAYGSNAHTLLYCLRWDTIKTTKGIKAVDWYTKEMTLYPNKQYRPWGGHIARFTDSAAISQKIAELKKINNENVQWYAHDLLRNLGRWEEATAFNKQIRQKFPRGFANRDTLSHRYYLEKDSIKAGTLLKQIGKLFPKDTAYHKQLYHVYRAADHLFASDMVAHDAEMKYFKINSIWAANVCHVGYEWAYKGQHLIRGEELTEQALEIFTKEMATDTFEINKEWRYTNYTGLVRNLFNIRLKLNKPGAALDALERAPRATLREQLDYHHNQFRALAMIDKRTALDTAEKYIRSGLLYPDTSVHKLLKPIYLQWRGNLAAYRTDSATMAADFDRQWRARDDREQIDKAKASVIKDMIDRPAPNFTLKDINGKPVTLSQFKGKMVIIAFDATWNGINEFSPLAGANEILKQHDDVVCLYVDTYNKGDKDHTEIKKKVAENAYNTITLIDDANSSVAKAYQAQGLPARAVIDKKGRIRFWHNNVTAPTVQQELRAIVELLR